MSSSSTSPADSADGGRRPPRAEVERQLERILADPLFQSSQRLRRFLRFAVESTLAGQAGQLKEYVIGVEVFELGASYNPQENPVVRIMAGRLRSKLAEYYLSTGLPDPIFIEIPKGGYVPRFIDRPQVAFPDTATSVPQPLLSAVCVGRDQELNRLWSAFAMVSGGGTMWSLSGEAGMGKTALGEDFIAGIQLHSPSAWIGLGSCSERLAETDAYVPILEAMHNLLSGRAGSQAEQAMKKTAPAWYRQLGPVTDGAGPRPNDRAPASHDRMRREIVDFFEELSVSGPIALFLDDLHWGDESTCDLLAYLGTRLQGLRLFILMAHRPTAVSARDNPFRRLKLDLERRGICQELQLRFLSVDNIGSYIAKQFPVNRFPEEFARVVHERTEGNPLFMTGMLRFLQERSVLAERDGAWVMEQALEEARKIIPAGIHSLIRLKLDRLDDADVQLLTCASVQGMQFDSAVIARALSRTPVQVEERLQELETAHNFVRCLGEHEFPDHTLSVRYQFVHVYYQNALYASLTPSRRAERSCAAAQALVAVTGGTSRAVAAEVALLFEAGRDYASAAIYFHHAARNAARLFAYPEAVNLCERGVKGLLAVAESRERDAQELALLLILSMALMVTRGYAAPEVEKLHRRSLELCLALNETRRLMPVLWGLHTCELNGGKLEASLKLAKQMHDLADSSGETAAVVPSLHALGTTLGFMGRLLESREALEQIFHIQPLSKSLPGSVYLLDPVVTSLSMLARLLALMGDLDQAFEKAASSVEIANRLAHPQSIAYATFWVGWIHHASGAYEKSLQYVEPAMSLSREHGLALIQEWGRVVRGSALAHLGRAVEGINEIRTSLANQDSMRSLLDRPYCLTLLAEALGSQGANEEAIALCDRALEIGSHTEGRFYEAATHRVRGELMLAFGHVPLATVEMELERALHLAREQESRLLELRAAVSYFRLQQKMGDSAHARKLLSEVAGWFPAGVAFPTLSEARTLLAGGHSLFRSHELI